MTFNFTKDIGGNALKKIKYCMIILLVMVTFAGCSNRIELTDDETDMLAEYISKEVLKRDKYYDQDLFEPENDLEDEDEEEVTKPNQSVVTQSNQTATNVGYVNPSKEEYNQVTVNDILGTSSVSVSYKSAKVYDSYPTEGNSYFVIESSKGHKLIAVTFTLKNNTAKDVTYSMLTTNVNYKLIMEKGSSYSPLLTLLVDDLQFVNKVIPASSAQEGVLVFRVAEDEVKSNATLEIVCGKQSTTLEIE